MSRVSPTTLGLLAALIALVVSLSTGVTAQTAVADSPSPACVSRPDCRFVGVLTLRTDEGVKTPALNRNMPFLRTRDGHERLWLVVGERVDIRLGGSGASPITVLGHGLAGDPPKSNAQLKDQVEIDFQQMPGSTATVMTVRNGYARQLQYKAYMLTQGGDEKPTSICPIPAGLFSMENWPGPLLEIELADLQLTDEQASTISCK
jgi:hypothetical protein